MYTFLAASLPRNFSISVCKVRTCKLLRCRVILKLIHESSAIDCLSFDLHYSSTMINLFSLHFWNQNTKHWCVCSSWFIIIVRELRWIWLNSFEFARVEFQTLHVDMPKKLLSSIMEKCQCCAKDDWPRLNARNEEWIQSASRAKYDDQMLRSWRHFIEKSLADVAKNSATTDWIEQEESNVRRERIKFQSLHTAIVHCKSLP